MITTELFLLHPGPRVKRVNTLLDRLGWRVVRLEGGETLRYSPANSDYRIVTKGLTIRVEYPVAEQ